MLGLGRTLLRLGRHDLRAIYFPTATGITHAQDCVFLLALAIGAFVLAERKRDFWSGAVLGLGLIKFHLFLLLPLVVLIQRRFRIFAGYCLTGVVALVIFLVLGGFAGMEKYVTLLRRDDLEWLSPSPELMINIQSVAANLGAGSAWAPVLLIGVVVLVTIVGAWHAELWRWLSAALLGQRSHYASRLCLRRGDSAAADLAGVVPLGQSCLADHRGDPGRAAAISLVSIRPPLDDDTRLDDL